MEKKVRPAKSHLAGRFGRRASARYQRRLPVVVRARKLVPMASTSRTTLRLG